jgi:L-alanine-DL-glutamate epimerase-like enolase superfamily enzyme
MLALDLALGAVDNAIHDVWARAAGRPALDLYDAEHVNSDAGEWLGSRFVGVWPGHGRAAPRTRLPVQHVVGVSDPIVASATDSDGVVGRSLDEWVRRERFESVKIKLAGANPGADAARVAEISQLMARYSQSFELALDPNEGYADVAEVADFLDSMRATAPDAMKRVTYLEQPISREQVPDRDAMAAVREHVPVIIDEGLAELRQLAELEDEGWSGLVVKAAKGQSFAVLCQTFASRSGMFLAVQDLTATDVALEHSARLAAALPVSSLGFEYNSRQYAPSANAELARRRGDLVTVTDGVVVVGAAAAGIY